MGCGTFSEHFLSISDDSTEDDCLDCLREIVDSVPEFLRADVTRPFFDEEPQVLRMRLATVATTSQNACRHAGIMALIEPKLAMSFSGAIRKTPNQYHELLLSMVQSSFENYSFIKNHRSHFLEEIASIGFVRAFFSLLDFSTETEVKRMLYQMRQTINGRRIASEFEQLIVSVLAESSRAKVLILAAKWLPTFIAEAGGKLKAIAMLQSHDDPHVKCIGIFHAISMSDDNELKTKYKIPSKVLWRTLLNPSLDLEARIEMEGFRGPIARVALRIISREIDHQEATTELCATISENWRRQTVSIEPAIKDLVVKNLARLYTTAGAPPPQKVIWYKNPLAAANAAEKYSKMLSVDASQITTAASWRHYYLHYKQWSTIEAYYARLEWLISELDKPRDWENHWRWHERHFPSHDAYEFVVGIGDWLRGERNDQFLLRMISKDRLWTIGFRSLLHELDLCSEPNDGFEEVLLNCGGFFAFEKVAFVVERPSRLHRDESGRVHCSDGKAVEYSDGWGCYVWKNVSVPEDLILSPQSLNKKRIDSERDPDLRWAMIDIYGLERYMEESHLEPIDESEYGSLYHLESSGNRPHLAILRVNDATPQTDGSSKGYFISVPVVQTAKQAVAWTFSMDAGEYNPLVET
jgi:hypothetical protein